METKSLLGQLLIDIGAITQDQLTEALEYQKTTHLKLGEILLFKGLITDEVLNTMLEAQAKMRGKVEDI